MATTNWSQKSGMSSTTEADNLESYVDQSAASQTAAAASEANAATSEVNAATSEANAAASATASSNSATAAASSETAAGVSQAGASSSESAAGASETNAAASATSASTDAATATTKAGEASTSETNAAASATAASGSAAAASNSQIAAANSAASAASVFDQFDDTYLGSKVAPPTLDNDGNALATGALYYDSALGGMYIWDGTEWIAASAAGGVSLNYFNYTATAGQTTFTGADDDSNSLVYVQNNLLVLLNGIIIQNGTDYTASDGTSIVLADAAVALDELNVVAFKSFTTADMVSGSTGGTFYGNVDFSAGIDVTGAITVTGAVDGRDVAADGTKLDGIEASADVTDAANVQAAGAVMDSEVTNLSQVKAFDTSDYATAAQGALADTATQPSDLGTAATTAASDYATAAQGVKADASVQATATTGQANLPSGTTAQRTAGPIAGAMRFNSTDTSFEGYNGTEWGSIGGGAADGIFYENEQNVTANYTIAASKNAMTTGPITIDAGVSVTIETGARWVVL